MNIRGNRASLISIGIPLIGIPLLAAISAPIAGALGDSEWGWGRMLILVGGCSILVAAGLGFAVAAWYREESKKLALLGTLINLAPVAYVIFSVTS